MTDAVAATRGMTGDEYRADALPHITTEAVVPRWMYDQAQQSETLGRI